MIDHEMERLGKIVAADQGLDVHVRGARAFAVKGAITLPAIEKLDHLDEQAYRMLHGLLDHEAAHAVDTDFDWLTAHPARHAFEKHVHNALEDGYIETRQAQRYEGSAYNLRRKNELAWTRGITAGCAGGVRERLAAMPVPDAYTLALTLVVRKHGGISLEDIRAAAPVIAGLLEETCEYWERLKTYDRTPRASKHVFAIAAQIVDYFGKSDRMRGLLGAKMKGPVSCGPGEEEESDGADPLSLIVMGGDLSPEDLINNEIERQIFAKTSDSTKPYVVYSHEWDVEHVVDPAQYSSDFENAVHLASDTLVQTFEASLKALRELHPVPGADEGEIDAALLAEYALGSAPADSIYRQYVAQDDRAVAVGVLVDCSGSMGSNNKAVVARDTAAAMAMALDACQIQHEVTGFSTIDLFPHSIEGDVYKKDRLWPESFEVELVRRGKQAHDAYQTMRARGEEPSRYARTFWGKYVRLPVHLIFKGWGSRDLRGLHGISARECNLDSEALLWQARRLSARPEPRRVLFVLSDGFPSGALDDGSLKRHLKESVARVVDAGIEVYGIGICSGAVREFYPQSWVVQNLAQLSETALEALTEILTAGRLKERQRCEI